MAKNSWGHELSGVIMSDRGAVIEEIQSAFAGSEHPGGRFLQGSVEGCEPYEEVGPFEDKTDWKGIEAGFLDGHANALSFFSEAGFRYFIPAYLITDLRGHLKTADPLFHLNHGFSDRATEVPVGDPAGDRTLVVRHGKSAFINPRRYGAMTSYDYARWRLDNGIRLHVRDWGPGFDPEKTTDGAGRASGAL
jgi:hypothetical protein